jgi:hypothetical protein
MKRFCSITISYFQRIKLLSIMLCVSTLLNLVEVEHNANCRNISKRVSKAHRYYVCTAINVSHHLHLKRLFAFVSLVNTQGIDPDVGSCSEFGVNFENVINLSGDLMTAAVYTNPSFFWLLSPLSQLIQSRKRLGFLTT